MTEDEKAVIVEVLCGLSLADHLGDVRREEETLWQLIGIFPSTWDSSTNSSNPYERTKQRLEKHGLSVPDYLLD